jgi:hypothetical protein
MLCDWQIFWFQHYQRPAIGPVTPQPIVMEGTCLSFAERFRGFLAGDPVDFWPDVIGEDEDE